MALQQAQGFRTGLKNILAYFSLCVNKISPYRTFSYIFLTAGSAIFDIDPVLAGDGGDDEAKGNRERDGDGVVGVGEHDLLPGISGTAAVVKKIVAGALPTRAIISAKRPTKSDAIR